MKNEAKMSGRSKHGRRIQRHDNRRHLKKLWRTSRSTRERKAVKEELNA